MPTQLWIYLAEVVIIMILTFVAIYRYMRKNTKIYVYITVYVGWFLGFVILATLPFDLYTSSVFDKENPTPEMKLYRDFMFWNWKISYFLTFALTWFIFPYLMVYVVRGEFRRWKRLWKTILYNIISIIIYLVICAILIPLVYFLVNKNKKSEERVTIFDVCFILSIVYGLVLIVFLMSYGMVAVPKTLWKRSNYKSRIKHMLYHVSIIDEKLTDLRIKLSNDIKDIESLCVGADLIEYLHIIKEEIKQFKENNPKFDDECASLSTLAESRKGSMHSIDTADVTLNKLEAYRSKLKINYGDYERIHAMLEYNIRDTMTMQARVNAKESKEFWDK